MDFKHVKNDLNTYLFLVRNNGNNFKKKFK